MQRRCAKSPDASRRSTAEYLPTLFFFFQHSARHDECVRVQCLTLHSTLLSHASQTTRGACMRALLSAGDEGQWASELVYPACVVQPGYFSSPVRCFSSEMQSAVPPPPLPAHTPTPSSSWSKKKQQTGLQHNVCVVTTK